MWRIVYFDIGGYPRSHGSDTRVDKWDDDTAFLFHLGYQFPLCYWLRVIPIIGYSETSCGYTDGYRWKPNGYGIVNKYIPETKSNGFDYGIQIVGNINRLTISATLTKRNYYFGVGIDI